MKIYDVTIVGLGSMGMSCAYYSASKGAKVLGLEQFTSPHNKGSHNGQTRIIRKAYFEHPDYVPLLQKAYDNWYKLENISNTKLFYKTGLNYFGTREGELLESILQSSKAYNVPIRKVKNAQGFKLQQNISGIHEEEAGFVLPEQTISSYKELLSKTDANILENTLVTSWAEKGELIEVHTKDQTFFTKKLIITIGAWVSKLLPEYKDLFRVTRQAQAWINVKDKEKYLPENFSCWNIETPEIGGLFYGFPFLEKGIVKQEGIKLAHHFPESEGAINDKSKKASQKQIDTLHNLIQKYFDVEQYEIIKSCTCLYTNSTDENFVIDYLPETNQNQIIAAGFSGHGFKFVPGIGELLADMALENAKDKHLDFLSLARFKNSIPKTKNGLRKNLG